VKDCEINREVGMHKWTPLYRAGEFILKIFKRIKKRFVFVFEFSNS